MSIKNKLNRLKPHITVKNKAEKKLDETLICEICNRSDPFMDSMEARKVSVLIFWMSDYCLIREMKYPLDMNMGNIRF